MEKYYAPEFKKKEFHCIHCGVFSAQHWHPFYFIDSAGYRQQKNDLNYCICAHCNVWSFWFKKRMIVPSEAPVPPAHQDLPDECIQEYQEARDIVARSPRAASALLRLSV